MWDRKKILKEMIKKPFVFLVKEITIEWHCLTKRIQMTIWRK